MMAREERTVATVHAISGRRRTDEGSRDVDDDGQSLGRDHRRHTPDTAGVTDRNVMS